MNSIQEPMNDPSSIYANGNLSSPPVSDRPKSPSRFLTTIRNSPSLLRKKIKPHHGQDSNGSPPTEEKERHRFGSKLRAVGEGSHSEESRVFHVLYQGKTRVATLQVHEAIAAVRKLTLTSGKTFDNSDNATGSKSPQLTPKIPRSPKLSPKLIIRRNKAPKKNTLKVTPKYLSIDDPKSSEVEIIPISTIAYCATDIRHPKVVAFINKDSQGGLLCHAILCETKDKASSIVSCIGKMFESAWEEWKESHPDPMKGRISPSCLSRSSSDQGLPTTDSMNSLTVPGEGGHHHRRRSFNGITPGM